MYDDDRFHCLGFYAKPSNSFTMVLNVAIALFIRTPSIQSALLNYKASILKNYFTACHTFKVFPQL